VIDVPVDRFESFVADAFERIPEEFASKIDNVAFLVEDDAEGRNLLGLYQGVPTTKRWHYSGAMPDRITLYRHAICRQCDTEDEVRALVAEVLIHEIGHYFGIDDARLRELGW